MLRPVTAHDTPSVVDLVVAAGMFSREDAQFLHEALLPHGDGTTCLVEDADDRGLASVVLYRPEEAADRVREAAERLAAGPALAVAAIKRCVHEGGEASLQDGLALEGRLIEELFRSRDATEGLTAFVEKRAPEFVGA